MALNSFQLFLKQVQSSPEVLRIRVLQIIFDMLMVHETDFMGKSGIGVCLACLLPSRRPDLIFVFGDY